MNKLTKMLELNHDTTGVFQDYEVLKKFKQSQFDFIVIGGSVDENSRIKIKQWRDEFQNNCNIIEGKLSAKLLEKQLQNWN